MIMIMNKHYTSKDFEEANVLARTGEHTEAEVSDSIGHFGNMELGKTPEEILGRLREDLRDCEICRKRYDAYVAGIKGDFAKNPLDAYFRTLATIEKRDFLGEY